MMGEGDGAAAGAASEAIGLPCFILPGDSSTDNTGATDDSGADAVEADGAAPSVTRECPLGTRLKTPIELRGVRAAGAAATAAEGVGLPFRLAAGGDDPTAPVAVGGENAEGFAPDSAGRDGGCGGGGEVEKSKVGIACCGEGERTIVDGLLRPAENDGVGDVTALVAAAKAAAAAVGVRFANAGIGG